MKRLGYAALAAWMGAIGCATFVAIRAFKTFDDVSQEARFSLLAVTHNIDAGFSLTGNDVIDRLSG